MIADHNEQTQPEPMDFSDTEMSAEAREVLIAAGLLPETQREPWRPTTLADVDFLGWKIKSIDAEIAAIQQQAERRIKRLQQTKEHFLSYAPDCEAVIREHLPRKKDGSFRSKYIDLERGRVKMRTVPGGLKVVDEQAALRWILEHRAELPEDVLAAVKAQRTQEVVGEAALQVVSEGLDGWKTKLLATPIKQFVLAGAPDEHGELQPRVIPGVVITEPTEALSFE